MPDAAAVPHRRPRRAPRRAALGARRLRRRDRRRATRRARGRARGRRPARRLGDARRRPCSTRTMQCSWRRPRARRPCRAAVVRSPTRSSRCADAPVPAAVVSRRARAAGAERLGRVAPGERPRRRSASTAASRSARCAAGTRSRRRGTSAPPPAPPTAPGGSPSWRERSPRSSSATVTLEARAAELEARDRAPARRAPRGCPTTRRRSARTCSSSARAPRSSAPQR